MVKKGNIVQYRERLDKSLALPDLTDEQILKTLVKSQLQRSSSKVEIEGCNEKLVETKTKEIYDFLSMLRSASGDNSAGSSTSRSDWKLKQDTEDFRVMYREGPEGTPFHTLLVEGYVDGPLDLSLCLSWESFLYKKWWPQFTIPSFKVLVSERLKRVQIGEHISLVRMKVPWPLSTREAIVHYYLFEYFQDDLVVVLLNTVSESTSIDNFNMDAIPEAKDVVRIDLLGGYAMQKVTSERSYFRIIGNLDIKLDFVPPTLINFISRQLIGSGFRLYQKAVASMLGNHKDKDISKALEDPLYVRIREALVIGEELKQDASFVPAEGLIQSEQNGVKDKDISCEYMSNQRAGGEEDVEAGCEEIVRVEEDVNKVLEVPFEEGDSLSVLINGEIEADNEEIEKEMIRVSEIPTEKKDSGSVLKDKMNGHVRSDVRRALETIERVISTVKEHGFHSRMPASNSEKVNTVDSSSAKPIPVCLKEEDSVKESSSNIREETSEEPATIQSLRQTEINPNLKEVNHKKVAPASADHNLSRPVEVNQIDSYSLKNGTTVQDISSEDMKKSTKEIRQNPKRSVRSRSLGEQVAKATIKKGNLGAEAAKTKMGWVWSDDNSDDLRRDISSEGCSITRVVKSQCRTEEVESGKFVRKCEKTEELLRNCIGKPVEVLQSNKEYTEEDITDEVLKGRSVPSSSSDRGVFDFPGLRNDIEVMERNLFHDLSRFLESAEEMTNGFFDVFGKSPRIFDAESSSPSVKREIPIASRPEAYPKTQQKESGDTDYVSVAQDV